MPGAALRRKPLPKPSPESDPRYRRVMEQLKQGAAKTKTHPPASKKAADAAAASKGPPNEKLAGGKAKQVDKIKEAKEGKPEQSSFLAILRAEIAKAMPKNLGETENFDQTAQQMKGGLKGNVSQQKDKSTQDVSGASKAAPAPSGDAKAEKPLPPEGAPPAPNVNSAEGMPAPKSDADVSLQDSKQDTDAQLKDAEVTPTQLKKANDPRFSAVLDAKTQVAQNADSGPGKYRAAEKATLTATVSGATSATRAGAAAMVGVKAGGNAKVLTRQQQQKAKDEAKRKEVTDKIESIYNATKARVDAKLAAIDGEVNGIFDRGVDAALTAMTNFVNAKIRDFKIRRYLSIPLLGLAAWVRDQFKGLPDEVNVIYDAGRALFQGLMDALIVRVANLVEQRLKEAKQEVAKGQADIKAYVASQPKDLQQFAQQAASDVNNRFQELEKGIEEKKNSLAQSLAQKYKEGFDKANEALKAIQDENKGLVQAFAEKLGEVLKAILEFKARLQAILQKGEDTIKLIIADPLGFLGNLISAVKGGISAFVGNIKQHLSNGFKKWLFGNLPPGVEIPADLSLVSIFKLVMGVLGISAASMRAKAVKLIGERNMKIIEKVIEYVLILIRGGPAALWEQVKTDLSNLKDMVIEAIKTWIIDTIVKQAVTKILSMFNPAGAIVQAIMAIYNIVMFVVERAAQIMEFVESVINSIHAIATGAIGGAIKRVEQALGNAVPILIGFLARLIGLGGIAQKIRDFIAKVQAKVDAAIDKAIAKIVAFVKKLFGKGGTAPEAKQKQLDDAMQASKGAVARFAGKGVGSKILKPILAAIRIRYGLQSLELVEQGKKWGVRGKVNPEKTETTEALNLTSVADKLKKAKDVAEKELADAVAQLDAVIKAKGTNTAVGDAIEAVKRAELQVLAAAGGGIVLPTKGGDAQSGKGIDAAFLHIIRDAAGNETYMLEIFELKGGAKLNKTMPIIARRSGNTGIPAGKKAIPVPVGHGKPIEALKANAAAIVAGTAALERGKPLENKLSGITENFDKNFAKMLGIIGEDMPPEIAAIVAQLKSGQAGTLQITVEMRRNAKFSDDAKAAAVALLQALVARLRSARGAVAANIRDAEIKTKAN
ncbi:MAG: hypothetical protein JO197_17815 [Acidobacteria bacterium]|nr:hypothetical protein [Acidobacteriota bacterium]MBV9478962.1 hypothetical protein [Acidobacteriota bacterium]